MASDGSGSDGGYGSSDGNDGSSLDVLVALVVYLGTISLTAIGGGVIMLAPDIQRYVVDVHRWMTVEQFAAAYTLAQAAPGPNVLYVTLVGLQVAGLPGAIAATVAIVLPAFLLTLAVVRFSAGRAPSRLGRAIRSGLAPVSIGLLAAAGLVLAKAADVGPVQVVLTLATVALAVRTRLNPVWMILGGAVVGIGLGL